MAGGGGVVAQWAAAPAGVHVGNGAIDVVGVDAAALAVAHVVAFEVDLAVEYAELVAYGFLLRAVGMTWMISHRSGSEVLHYLIVSDKFCLTQVASGVKLTRT